MKTLFSKYYPHLWRCRYQDNCPSQACWSFASTKQSSWLAASSNCTETSIWGRGWHCKTQLDAIHDHLNNSAMERITWIIIWFVDDFFLVLFSLIKNLRLIVAAILVELVGFSSLFFLIAYLLLCSGWGGCSAVCSCNLSIQASICIVAALG